MQQDRKEEEPTRLPGGYFNTLPDAKNILTRLIFRDLDLISAVRLGMVNWYFLEVFLLSKTTAEKDHEGMTALCHAAREGHHQFVSKLIEKGWNVNHADANGMTPLMHAAFHGHLKIFTLLAAAGADINAADAGGRRAISYAASHGRLPILRYLIEKKAVTDFLNHWGNSLVDHALEAGTFETIRFLVEVGGVPIDGLTEKTKIPLNVVHIPTLYFLATLGEHYAPKVKWLLALGADANRANPANNITPLFAAAMTRNLRMAAALLDQGSAYPSINHRCGPPLAQGGTALFQAATTNNVEMTRLLIKHGASCEIEHVGGSTALLSAVTNDCFSTVKCLVEEGRATVDHANDHGMTPLYLALYRAAPLDRDDAYVDFLMTHGADVNYRCASLLRIAVTNNHASVLNALLKYGADANRRENHADTALFLAARHGREGMVDSLLEHGADPSLTTRKAKFWLERMAEHLIPDEIARENMRAFIAAHDEDAVDISPLEIARIMGHGAIAEKLALLREPTSSALSNLFAAQPTVIYHVVLSYVFPFLDPITIANLSLTCKNFYEVSRLSKIQPQHLYRFFYEKHYGNIPPDISFSTDPKPTEPKPIDWFNAFTKAYRQDCVPAESYEALTPKKRALFYAVRSCHYTRIQALLLLPKDVFDENVLYMSDRSKKTLITHIRNSGSQKIKDLFFEWLQRFFQKDGTDLDTSRKDSLGNGIAHYVAAMNQENQVLLDKLFLGTNAANQPGFCGYTPLHYAAVMNNKTLVLSLLTKYGASLDAETALGSTAVHMAATNNNADMVKFLLDQGADPNVANIDGWSPLHRAASQGHVKMLELLLDQASCNPNPLNKRENTPLILACQGGHLDAVKYLVTHPTKPALINHLPALQPHDAALTAAIYRNHGLIVSYLLGLKNGAEINAVTPAGLRPINDAITAKHCHTQLATFLLDKGAAVSMADNSGPVAIRSLLQHYLTKQKDGEKNKDDIVALLFRLANMLANENANIHAKNTVLAPVLYFALASPTYHPIADDLIRLGLDVNYHHPDDPASVPLLVQAIRKNHLTVLEALLNRGANPNIVAAAGGRFGSALCEAVLNRNKPMISMLLAHQADPSLPGLHQSAAWLNELIERTANQLRLSEAYCEHMRRTSADFIKAEADADGMILILPHQLAYILRYDEIYHELTADNLMHVSLNHKLH